MEISLSRHSWHAKYYNFVKGYYPTYEFKSLCPYFWTIVTLILLSPVIVIWKVLKPLIKGTIKSAGNVIAISVGKVLSQPSKPRKKPSKFSKWYDRNGKKIGEWFGKIYLITMGLIALIVMIGSIVNMFHVTGAWLGFVYIFAIIGGLVSLILLIWMVISFFETDSWKMIKGMIYSTKNKVCPMLTWKTDENN
jgi:hypothetical protein